MNVLPVRQHCEQAGIPLRLNAPASEYTTFRVGGPFALLAEPRSGSELAGLLELCRAEKIPCFLLGRGSNLLVSDRGFDGVAVRLGPQFSGLVRDGDTLKACAGATLSALCRLAAENGLAGLEFACGIPGTVGGGVVMNAGAYGGELRDVLVSVDCLDENLRPAVFAPEACDFSYRHSVFSDRGLPVVAAEFRLTPDDPAAIRARMEDFLARRAAKQPLEYPSAGSTFLRPPGHFAGALIEQAGLKGCRIGGARVSEKHAGFLINAGGATAADIAALIAHVRKTVLETAGVELRCEVRFLGEF